MKNEPGLYDVPATVLAKMKDVKKHFSGEEAYDIRSL